MKKLLFFTLLVTFQLSAQEQLVEVVTQNNGNRIAFYAVNENEHDVDVLIKINGTNIRQSKAKPRLIRVPGAAKVHLKTIMTIRGKTPTYSHDLTVNDSLSKRAVRKEFERIKINPKKSITVYITDGCTGCDSIVSPLEKSNYIFKSVKLNEHPEITKQLKKSFPTSLDSISKPIINLGGRLYTNIEFYDDLLETLNKD